MQYVVKGRRFDGWDKARRVLLDAKDNYGFILDKGGNIRSWFNLEEKILEKARLQREAAGETPIEWHCSQKEVADALGKELAQHRITVRHTPPVFVIQ